MSLVSLTSHTPTPSIYAALKLAASISSIPTQYRMDPVRPSLIAGFLITAIVFFGKFVIAFLVIKGLGIDVNFWQVIYLQLIIFLVIYFAPTPGASGVSEVSTAYIMGQIIPRDQIGVFVILWRFFILFIGMIVGGYVLDS